MLEANKKILLAVKMSSNTEVFPVTPREIVRILGALNAEEIERILNIIKLMREEGILGLSQTFILASAKHISDKRKAICIVQ